MSTAELIPLRPRQHPPAGGAAAALGEAMVVAIAEAVDRRDDGTCLKLSEVARRLDVHPDTVTKLTRSGQLPVVHVASAKRVRLVDLIAYLDRSHP